MSFFSFCPADANIFFGKVVIDPLLFCFHSCFVSLCFSFIHSTSDVRRIVLHRMRDPNWSYSLLKNGRKKRARIDLLYSFLRIEFHGIWAHNKERSLSLCVFTIKYILPYPYSCIQFEYFIAINKKIQTHISLALPFEGIQFRLFPFVTNALRFCFRLITEHWHSISFLVFSCS